MIVTRAPLRIPVGGGGTDFPTYYKKYGGMVLGFALDRYCHVVVHNTIDNKIRLKYSKTECVDDPGDLENRVAGEALKWYGITGGIEVATFSDVPESSGLGGSSSFCVALCTALRYLKGMSLDKYEIFASAYDIERNKARQPGGLQDQFFAAFGGAWLLELPPEGEFVQTAVEIQDFLPRLKLVYTNTGRIDLGIAARQNWKVTGEDKDYVDNLTRTKEMGYAIKSMLDSKDYDSVGRMFNEHWCNKKRRDVSISNDSVDSLYKTAMSDGCLGGKLLGLGGGGYLLLYAKNGLSNLQGLDVGLDTEGCKVVYSNGKV